jgi:hypothetical protein
MSIIKPNVVSCHAEGNTLGTLFTSEDYYRLAMWTSSSNWVTEYDATVL